MTLREAIAESGRIVFFGGAGVSTESGIKDYRSKDGLYRSAHTYGVPPEVILSRSFFDENPKVFYDFYFHHFIRPDVKPNRAHLALARLEKQGKLRAIITQNVDGLHQAAGSKNVLELHGTTSRYVCTACGAPYGMEKIASSGGAVPHCDICGCIVRPKVVLYEERLDDEVLSSAVDAIMQADMLIVGGSSLVVNPAASLIRYYAGKLLVIINQSQTPFDSYAAIRSFDSIGKVLDEAIDL